MKGVDPGKTTFLFIYEAADLATYVASSNIWIIDAFSNVCWNSQGLMYYWNDCRININNSITTIWILIWLLCVTLLEYGYSSYIYSKSKMRQDLSCDYCRCEQHQLLLLPDVCLVMRAGAMKDDIAGAALRTGEGVTVVAFAWHLIPVSSLIPSPLQHDKLRHLKVRCSISTSQKHR